MQFYLNTSTRQLSCQGECCPPTQTSNILPHTTQFPTVVMRSLIIKVHFSNTKFFQRLVLLVVVSAFCFWGFVEAQRGPQPIRPFRSFIHDVRSGEVVVLDEKTILIRNFNYDGQGPAAWFVAGRGSNFWVERVIFRRFTVIPDQNGSCGRLSRYNNQTIELVLPGSLTFRDINYLSVYCLEFAHNFGYLEIPSGLELLTPPTTALPACQPRVNLFTEPEESPPASSPPLFSRFVSTAQNIASMFTRFFGGS